MYTTLVQIDDVYVLSSMTLANVPINMATLLHSYGAVGTLDFRLLTTLELRVSFQVARMHVALAAT